MLSFLFASLLCLIPWRVNATEIDGYIDTNTTWTLAESPYDVNVEVAEGVTLTIEPGVEISGYISLMGSLTAIGTPDKKITFKDTYINFSGNGQNAYIQYSVFNRSGIPIITSNGGEIGSVTLLDSIIHPGGIGCGGPYMELNALSCNIERNIFYNMGGTIRIISNQTSAVMINNVFYNADNPTCGGLSFSGTKAPVIEFNSFIISLKPDWSHFDINGGGIDGFTLINNYWGTTTDTTLVDTIIYDKNDYYQYPYYVEYLPMLTTHHPDTPYFNIYPVANAGEIPTMPIGAEITVDGSLSSDKDGSIVMYSWFLKNNNDSNEYFAEGNFVTITGLTRGNYSGTLTVTDDYGDTGSTDFWFQSYGDTVLPIANAGNDLFANANQTVILDGSQSYDTDGTITNYEWYVLPKNEPLCISANPICEHKALGLAEEVVQLIVTDDSGASSSDILTIFNPGVSITSSEIQTIKDKISALELANMELTQLVNGIATDMEKLRKGDLNLSGFVDGQDLAIFSSEFGK